MLMALLLTMLLGGGSPEIFSKADFRQVQQVVTDPARAEAAQESMQHINTQLETLTTERAEYFNALNEIDANLDAPIVKYEAVFEDLWRARRMAAVTYTKEVFVLRESMTRDEWYAAFANASD